MLGQKKAYTLNRERQGGPNFNCLSKRNQKLSALYSANLRLRQRCYRKRKAEIIYQDKQFPHSLFAIRRTGHSVVIQNKTFVHEY